MLPGTVYVNKLKTPFLSSRPPLNSWRILLQRRRVPLIPVLQGCAPTGLVFVCLLHLQGELPGTFRIKVSLFTGPLVPNETARAEAFISICPRDMPLPCWLQFFKGTNLIASMLGPTGGGHRNENIHTHTHLAF